MAKFSVDPLKENSIMYLYAIRDEIDFNPSYQRQGDIWPPSKQALLIDSLLNGFDIPKIYFHEVNKKQNGKLIRFAVIDGKQRLQTIFSFLDGKFGVSPDFEDLAGVFGEFAGKGYKDFGNVNLKLKARFEALPLPVHVVKTTDLDLIEEMFYRLNEASPLNAAEKRNAYGGPIPQLLQELSASDFFKARVPFNNHRYRHLDVAAKLLLLVERGKITDTKRIHLDKFVKSYVGKGPDSVTSLSAKALQILGHMGDVFINNDKLLKLVTIVPVYFALFMILHSRGVVDKANRPALVEFEEIKRKNRELAQADEENAEINYDLLEFDRLAQSPNDSSSIEFKVNILLKFMDEEPISNKSIDGKP
jgi:hypothetical protein